MATRGRPRKTEEEKKAGRLRLKEMSPEERLENAAKHLVEHKIPNYSALIPSEDENDVQRFIRNGLEIMNLPPIDMDDCQQVGQRINEYFQIITRNSMRPGVVGFANAFDLNRWELYSILHNRPITREGQVIRVNSDSVHLLKKAYAFIEQQWEESMQNGKINPASGIFLGKNHYGYTDVQEHVLTADTEKKSYDTTDIGSRYLPDSDSDGTVE